ncbi:MAG: tRNA epoxyqueuosine(34) reductase QueG [Gammaproteobacteria bacterium]|nr:tRNA epoxyqueuosine(34) reductase QueG [Gammaproteobacteria bacterium]
MDPGYPARVKSAADLRDRIRASAGALGFDRVRFTTPHASGHMEFYRSWIEEGAHGEMGYLAREDSIARRGDLRLTMADVRSVVLVTHNYYQADPPGLARDGRRAVIARYARGDDYHDVMKRRLVKLLAEIEGDAGRRVSGRAYVDTGPILERELAMRAGLGWLGKNTMLIHPKSGSYFFLGILLLDLELPEDEPFTEDRCGTCRSCLDACPTGALLGRDAQGAPVMDARRCISYLTIEHRGPIPRELRAQVGNRIYGCDICQEVCPWNVKFQTPATEPAYRARPELDGPLLVELAERLLAMDGAAFSRAFRGSPVKRARRDGLLRNVCVGLGNQGGEDVVVVLIRALQDQAPLVRGHAAWGLGRMAESTDASAALRARMEVEDDAWVREEIAQALEPELRADP